MAYRDPEYAKKYYAKNKRRSYWNQVRRLYKLEEADVMAIGEKQNWDCPICLEGLPREPGKFQIDHCHDTGRVRGLLHRKCNAGLGLFSDNPGLLINAVSYLKPRRARYS